MNPFTANWRFLCVLFLASCFLAASTQFANAQQEPFSFVQPPFTQELYATAPLPASEIDGGIAFAPNGDLWVDSCNRNKLFRFSASQTVVINGSTVHALLPGSPIPSNAGCGLTNHPDGTLYSNSGPGLVNLDASTGAQLRPVFGPPGNGFGIAVDPQTNNLVYVGGAGACGGVPPCVIFSVNPVTQAVTTFAQLSSAEATFVDGIFFDPTGNFLFLAVRNPDRGLTVLDRNGAVVQHVHMVTFPDGVAFHSSPDFVATNDNEGTISRFDFPGNNFTVPPPQQFLLAAGGFRGDLSQVGPDGCLFVTQNGTRFADGSVSPDNSVVRICPGFVPPPGVVPAVGSFVIGDLDATPGQQVTFWGAQWAKNNALSGGSAPAAFKGFTTTVPQGCGGTWTSGPGNSPAPPDSVPAVIAVIVSSNLNQSGSSISGDVKEIVLVRTDPGYGPAPGHVATGTVVSVLCGGD